MKMRTLHNLMWLGHIEGMAAHGPSRCTMHPCASWPTCPGFSCTDVLASICPLAYPMFLEHLAPWLPLALLTEVRTCIWWFLWCRREIGIKTLGSMHGHMHLGGPSP